MPALHRHDGAADAGRLRDVRAGRDGAAHRHRSDDARALRDRALRGRLPHHLRRRHAGRRATAVSASRPLCGSRCSARWAFAAWSGASATSRPGRRHARAWPTGRRRPRARRCCFAITPPEKRPLVFSLRQTGNQSGAIIGFARLARVWRHTIRSTAMRRSCCWRCSRLWRSRRLRPTYDPLVRGAASTIRLREALKVLVAQRRDAQARDCLGAVLGIADRAQYVPRHLRGRAAGPRPDRRRRAARDRAGGRARPDGCCSDWSRRASCPPGAP